jgi:hypothetical protein
MSVTGGLIGEIENEVTRRWNDGPWLIVVRAKNSKEIQLESREILTAW